MAIRYVLKKALKERNEIYLKHFLMFTSFLAGSKQN